jgi:hypothetical protein
VSAGTHVRAGLVAYSQGAPEVIVRMDKASARELRRRLEETADIERLQVAAAVSDLLRRLQALDLEERPRGR